MKRSERMRREAEQTMKKIRGIAKHIRNVEENCFILGEKLIENGEVSLGRNLIANGYVHDASKFHGIEFEYMAPGVPTQAESAKLKLKMAIHQHNSTNKHHPEAWSGGIKDMPDLYLAEMACDIKARSEEFGTDLRDWINTVGLKKWGITTSERTYKDLMKYVNLLCAKPFENLGRV